MKLRANIEMNTARPGSVFEHEIVADGLAEFDMELDIDWDRVDPRLAVVPVAAVSPAPVARDALHLSAVRRSWSGAAQIAVAATLAISAGSGLAVYWAQRAPVSAGPTKVPIKNEAPLRPFARAATSAAPPQRQPDPPRVEAATPVGSADRSARTAVDQALETYRRSYNTLDAASVAAIWPQADTQALAQVFSTLRYQNLSFERCDVRLTGTDRALASCEGSISSVPRSGDPTVQRRRASWTIALQRVADRWVLASVEDR